jgi:hypothetical protein
LAHKENWLAAKDAVGQFERADQLIPILQDSESKS